MSPSIGFGKPKKQSSSKKPLKKGDPQISLKFEKRVEKVLGKDWSKGLTFTVFDRGKKEVELIIKVPIEYHYKFTEKYQQILQDLGKKYGLDRLEIKLVNLSEKQLWELVYRPFY